MQCVNRSIPPRLLRGLTTPLDWVQPISGANRPGSWGVSSSLPKICLRIRGKSILRQGDRAATSRCQPRFRKLSSDGATLSQMIIDFLTRRQKSTRQPIEPLAIDGKDLRCESFRPLYAGGSTAQCIASLPGPLYPVTTPRHHLRRLRLTGQSPDSSGEIPACRQARRHSCSSTALFA
jgi:hypothetical protein